MALAPGARLGPYEILSALGAGGMGEVYKARDTKLGREVALKVVSDGFVHDPERVARFQREAHLLAALNHSHIGAIYGLEDFGGAQCLILELVEGNTLADRLKAGPLPLDETVAIARQVADALQAAHEKGIIHRDLKPSNIALTHDGQVKVLDFGLAKALASEAASATDHLRQGFGGQADLTASPTITSPAMMTGAGTILGTAAYMAPEQAKGRAADKRCDVWAFGCVLYEMLTAKRAFEGEDVSDTLAAVLRGEPDWAALPATVPAAMRTLMQRCLAKDRRQRIAEIAVAQFVLDDPASVAPATAAPTSSATIAPRPPLWRRMAIPSGTWLIGVAMAGAVVWFATRTTIPPPRVSRFLITPPSAAVLTVSGFFHDLVLTPDGARLVYVGANNTALFVRALDQLDATPLTGLGAPGGPFVSPDGQWIGFFDGVVALKKVAITGGPAVTLGYLDGLPLGASWGADGTIIFATANLTTGLQRLAASGGAPLQARRQTAGCEDDRAVRAPARAQR